MSVSRVQETPISAIAAHPPVTIADAVQKIALACLKEFALSLALGFTVACFVATPAGVSVLATAALVQFTISVFFHSLGTFASYKAAQKGPNQIHFKRLLSACEWITGFNFAILTGYNAQFLIHETGHALAAIAAYKRPRPQIAIYPFVGGATEFYKAFPSLFGKKIGPVATTWLIVASGPFLTLFVSTILFVIGLRVQKTYPQLSKYFIAWATVDFLYHADYAYSALQAAPWNLHHDFYRLSILGLPPKSAAIGILAIPIVIALGMHCLSKELPSKASSETALQKA